MTSKRRNKRRERIATAIMGIAVIVILLVFLALMGTMLLTGMETIQHILIAVGAVSIIVAIIAGSNISLD